MFIDSALVVASQVLILFLLIGLGLVIARLRWVSRTGLQEMTVILLYIVTPCVIIDSFQMKFSPELLVGLLISAVSAIVSHLAGIILSRLIFLRRQHADAQVIRFGIIFSNCGFMCVPLLYAVLGNIGVFYGSVYIAVFYTFHWTYGVVLMTGNKSEIRIKQALINPGTIGTFLGLLFFLFRYSLPNIAGSVISYTAGLNTPLAMFIIGAHLTDTTFMEIWRSKATYLISLWRLLLLPVVTMLVVIMLPVDRDLLLACVIPASAPCAAATVLFAAKYRKNALLASHAVSMTTFLSIITMPVMILLAETLLSLKQKL